MSVSSSSLGSVPPVNRDAPALVTSSPQDGQEQVWEGTFQEAQAQGDRRVDSGRA